MAEYLSVANAPKTSTFQMRINPDIKEHVEDIYARCGMTLTDAINVFIQQSINAEGMPLIITQNSKEAMKEQAIAMLMGEIKKGENSVKTDNDWISEKDILSEFGGEI
ncbi:MAG: type II toxin-antitoxin system RelB/DinJ family antitoxin [Oscillospiraceae bacterium]|nr:type II toxin-antitoxin system RelB/DinJ family antitoxin [Oscillospiraceae bacterium]